MSENVANGPGEGVSASARTIGSPHAMPPLTVVGAAFMAILLTLSGASDSDELGFAHRLTLWCVICGSLAVQACVLDAALTRVAPPGRVGRTLSALGAITGTLVLMTLELFVLERTPLTPHAWGRDPLLDLGLFIAPQVAAMAGFFVLLRSASVRRATRLDLVEDYVVEQLSIAAQPVIAGLLPPPAWLGELPGWPASETVQWVHASDHYLEVATPSAKAFVRARMRDAVARLRDRDGLQVHRSWWVARDAVRDIRRDGRDLVVILHDGEEIPVGRSRIRALRARGWI